MPPNGSPPRAAHRNSRPPLPRAVTAALGGALLLYVAALAWPTQVRELVWRAADLCSPSDPASPSAPHTHQDLPLYVSLGRALGPPDPAPSGTAAARLAALGRGLNDPPPRPDADAEAGRLGGAIAAAATRLEKQARKHGRLPPRGTPSNGVHVVATSNGSPYLNIQTRILYASYKTIASGPGGASMTGFTRILHRSAPDALVGEVPTVRVDPATPACDAWCEFPVADRPPAFAAWLAAVARGEAPLAGRWVALIETDYVFIAPLAPPPSDTPPAGLVFPFGYITPAHPAASPCVTRLLPAGVGVDDVPGTGPAPALLPVDTWAALTPHWVAAAAAIEGDRECKAVLGWVREMYAFSIAVAAVTLRRAPRPDAPAPPHSPLTAQPPADATPGVAATLHYTWGTSIVREGDDTVVWAFDKRAWTDAALVTTLPTLPDVPPWSPDWRLAGGEPVSRELRDTLAVEAAAINSAVASLGALG